MEQKINYIKAHKAIQLLTKNDIELRPIHKSMIDAIFMYWNIKEWAELFNIDRDSLMEYSKVSNRKTYYEILSFLQEREYIVYKPSKNPDIASVFGMGKKVTSAITSDGSSAIPSGITSDGTSGGTIYINIQTLKQETLKLINDNASLVDENLKDWIKEFKPKQETINYDLILNYFKEITDKKIKIFGDKEKAQLKARLKDGFTYDDICLAIKNCYTDSYHIETNHKYLTLEFILRQDKLNKFTSINNLGKQNKTVPQTTRKVFNPNEHYS